MKAGYVRQHNMDSPLRTTGHCREPAENITVITQGKDRVFQVAFSQEGQQHHHHHHYCKEDVEVEHVEKGESRTTASRAAAAAATAANHPKPRPRCSWFHIVSVMLGLGILLVIILLIVYLARQKDISPPEVSSLDASSEHTAFQGIVATAELQQHASDDDCWLVLHGNVYDLTDYALEHPGGPEYITDHCGVDATHEYAVEHPVSLLRTIRARTWLGVYDETAEEETDTPEEEDEEEDAPSEPESEATTEEPPEQEDEMEPEPEEDKQPQDDGQEKEQEATPFPEEEETTPSPDEEETTPSPDEEETSAPESMCRRQFYNLATVAEHDSRDDCWYILYGLVYDLTGFVDRHPGGARRVFNECGTDATLAYEDERWHDRQLLRDEGMSVYIIGNQGDTTGLLPFACNE